MCSLAIVVPLPQQLALLLHDQDPLGLFLQAAVGLIAAGPWHVQLHQSRVFLVAESVDVCLGEAAALPINYLLLLVLALQDRAIFSIILQEFLQLFFHWQAFLRIVGLSLLQRRVLDCLENIGAWAYLYLFPQLSLFVLPPVLALKGSRWLNMLLFLKPFCPPSLEVVLVFFVGLFCHVEVVVVNGLLFREQLRLVLLELIVEAVLRALPGEGVALADIERGQGRLVRLVVVLVLDQQVLLVIAHHPAEVVLLFPEATRHAGRRLALRLGHQVGFCLEIAEGVDEPFGQVLLVVLEPRFPRLEALHSHVLDLELEHSAGDAGQVYIKITLHQQNYKSGSLLLLALQSNHAPQKEQRGQAAAKTDGVGGQRAIAHAVCGGKAGAAGAGVHQAGEGAPRD